MYTFKVLSILFALIFCVSMLYGCGSDDNKGDLSMRYFPVTPEPQPEPSNISLSIDNLDLEHFAGTSTVQIRADCAWNISFRGFSNNKEPKEIDWIKAEPSSGTGDCEVTLTFEDNRTLIDNRACELIVTSKSGTIETALIKQEGVTCYNVKKGDRIEFGRYPQSADGDINDPNTYEPLTWVSIYDNNDFHFIQLYTEQVIDNMVMDTSDTSFFPNSKLRDFLKGDFYDKAFNDEEKSIMKEITIFSVNSIVSIATEYDNIPNEIRCCKPTEYALAHGIAMSDNGYSRYWLFYHPTSGEIPSGCLPCIGYDGKLDGEFPQNKCGVRPNIFLIFNN